MKVLLINVSLRPDSPKLLFPIGLGYIASAIDRAGFDLQLLDIDACRYSDDEVRNILQKEDYDVVAMGCIVTSYRIIKELCATVRECSNAPIVVGNSVASSIPEILLGKTEADIAVMGEGDITVVEILKALESKKPLESVDGIYFKKDGKIVATNAREAIRNLDDIPFINRSLFDMETYISKAKNSADEPYRISFEDIRLVLINTARGCAHKCSFCYHVFRDERYRVRSPEFICREIAALQEEHGINHVKFADELTFYSQRQCREFVDTIIRHDLNIYWRAVCRADLFTVDDLDLLLECKDAGCIGLGFSLENANREILEHMNKKLDPQDFVAQVKACQKAGMPSYTSLVIGYPAETEDTIKQTFDCCYECDIYPSTGYLLPQPGTPMYDYAIDRGLIKDEEEYLLTMGDRQDFRINLTQMEPERIQELVKYHLKRISDKMNLGLDGEGLIKTSHYKASNRQN
ncbi:B12-binding domain-containing radical SAM protein [Verrucomicrobiota bacterium]